MSPSPAAPSTASINACVITSPSEWPASPRGDSNAHATEHERHAVLERVRVHADPDTQAHPSGSCRACALLEDRHRLVARPTQQLPRAVEVAADDVAASARRSRA